MTLKLLTAAALGLVLSSAVVANPGHGDGDRADKHLDRMSEKLELNEAQREQIRALMAQHREQTAAAREQLKQAHEQLRDDIRALLTAEQAQKLDQMHEKKEHGHDK